MNEAWSLGPDPRSDLGYYLTNEELETNYPDGQ